MNFGFRISDFGFKPLSQRTVSLRIQSAIRNPKSAMSRSGFTFAEVLFAVIVLGIGFIMIAAVFPVAITQSKATKEETTAAAVVQQGVELLQQAGQWDAVNWQWVGSNPTVDQPPLALGSGRWSDQSLPHTYPWGTGVFATPQPTPDPAGYSGPFLFRGDMKPISTLDANPYVQRTAEMLRSSRINPSDPRFAWVAFYRRDMNLYRGLSNLSQNAFWKEVPFNFAQIIVIGVQSQGDGHLTYNGSTTVTDPESDVNQGYETGFTYGTYPVRYKRNNLDPRPIRVVIKKNQNDPVGQIIVSKLETGDPYFDNATNAAQYVNSVAPGTFVVIAHDNFQNNSYGRFNGRIYKVGAFIKTQGNDDYYELSPDGDFERDAGEDGIAGNNDDILGVGWSNATDGSQTSNVTVSNPAIAFVIGKPMVQRNDVTKGFTGNTMDVSVYTTFIQVK